MWLSTRASPRCSESTAMTASLRSSVGASTGASSVAVSSANDDRLLVGAAGPAGSHVLVLDPLLEQHDPLEEGLGPRRAARHEHVDGDDLVDALGDRVAVPVRAAAVGERTHGDDVLRVGNILVTAADGRDDLVGGGGRDDHAFGCGGG